MAHARLVRVHAGQKTGARRRAARRAVELCESDSARGKRIQIRRGNLAAIRADVGPSHVVDQNDDDVWARVGLRRRRCPQGAEHDHSDHGGCRSEHRQPEPLKAPCHLRDLPHWSRKYAWAQRETHGAPYTQPRHGPIPHRAPIERRTRAVSFVGGPARLSSVIFATNASLAPEHASAPNGGCSAFTGVRAGYRWMPPVLISAAARRSPRRQRFCARTGLQAGETRGVQRVIGTRYAARMTISRQLASLILSFAATVHARRYR